MALWCLRASVCCDPESGFYTFWHLRTKFCTSFFSCTFRVKIKKFSVSDTLVYELLVASIFIFEERNPRWFVEQVFPRDSVFETTLSCLRASTLIWVIFSNGPESKWCTFWHLTTKSSTNLFSYLSWIKRKTISSVGVRFLVEFFYSYCGKK